MSSKYGDKTSGRRTFWYLLQNLIAKEFVVRYGTSKAGVVWVLVKPLMLIGVFALVFGILVPIGIPNYMSFLLSGLIHWNFFASSVLGGTQAVLGNANLIQKAKFPRMIMVYAQVGYSSMEFVFGLVVTAILYAIFGTGLWWGLLLYPFVLGMQMLFVLGCVAAVGAITVFFRDLRELLEVGILLWFWLTPVIYPLPNIRQPFLLIYLLNPMAMFMEIYHQLWYGHTIPSMRLLFAASAASLATFAIGYWIFHKLQGRFAEAV